MAVDPKVTEEQIRQAEELLFSGKPLPSFAKGLFFGLFDSKRVLPWPGASQEERAKLDDFCARLNAWALENIDADAIDRTCDIPDSVIKGLGELGVLGCSIPEKFGGLGFSQYAYCRMVEEIARHCGSTALFINAHQSIGMKALVIDGNEEQQDEWLPRLAKGEILAAFALTEPNAGSDAAGVETRAEYNAERDTYIINGKKQWITNGGIADILTVMAQTTMDTPRGPEDKITAFLVTPDMPGFKVDEVALEKCGMRGTKTAKLSFENLEVPAKNILGEKGRGLNVALNSLNFGRTTFGAGCTGNAKDMLERAIEHAKARHQFKRPLAGFGMVKGMIARMSATVYAMESTTFLTAGLLDRGEEDYMLETAILKVFASDSQWSICYECMQIMGGRSFFTDQPFERYMRDARLNTIGEGSNEVLRNFIAVVGLRDVAMQLKDVADSLKTPLSGVKKALGLGMTTLEKVLSSPQVPVQSPQLEHEAKQLGQAVRRFGLSLQRLLATHKEGVIEQQLTLNRMADAAISIYTVTAVLSRLDQDLARSNGDREALDTDLARGKLYCKMAFAKLDDALDHLFKNYDQDQYDLSRRLTNID
mgnify:CR=1 FL=1